MSSSSHPAFVSPDELAQVRAEVVDLAGVIARVEDRLGELVESTTERLEARALRAERAILSLEERLEAAEALARDRIAEAERLHRALEMRLVVLERYAQ